MVNSIQAIGEDIRGQFWATLGLENGVQEQTETALAIVQEVVVDLPHMEGIAVVPVGSRFKGYATLESDLDLAMVVYDENAMPYKTRRAIGEAVRARLGISVCTLSPFPDEADEALTIDFINHSHGAYNSEQLPLFFSPSIFEGKHVPDYKDAIIKQLATKGEAYLSRVSPAFERHLLQPKFTYKGVADRYADLLSVEGRSERSHNIDVDGYFRNAYQQRCSKYGSSIIAASNMQ